MQALNPIPTLPEELKQAALDGTLVIFVGAGASRLLGCPSWDGLADLVLESLAKVEIITYGDVERLKYLEARKKLSIAHQIASENGQRIDYKALLKHDESKSKIYSHINAIGCTYVTTNYDLLITPTFKSKDTTKTESFKRIYAPEQFLAGRLREPCTVVHLHGCLLDERKMILTTTQYLEHYEDRFVQDFLDDMFRHHTVLFLGYGLEETEILEHVLRKGKVRSETTPRRFMIQGFFEDQQKLYEFLYNYYLTFGVHLRGYSLDKRNHLQHFLYMSRDWTLSRLSKVFDQSNTRKWLCAMQGYAYVTNLYDNIYDHLKEKGDFLKVLEDENVSESIRENILKHAVIFYITGHEKIDDPDSLISIILERKQYEELRYIIWYIWTLRDRNIENIQDTVYTLWPKFLDIIDFNNIDGKKLASQLCHWVSFIDTIDTKTKKWLLQIAPYSEVEYNSHDLLKGLARISDSQPSEVREVWLKMLETYSSAYPPDAIKQILRNLINMGVEGERMAVEIVDSYLRYGEEKPRIIFSEIKESIKATE